MDKFVDWEKNKKKTRVQIHLHTNEFETVLAKQEDSNFSEE